jgi:hypothetical protein
MFVAASIGSSVFSEQHRVALQAFISPTVVNFAAVLFVCIGVMIPSQTWLSLGVLLAGGGIAGLVYAGRVWVQMVVRRRFNVDIIDRIFYASVPLVGYLLVLAAGILLLLRMQWSAEVTAAALVVLMFAAIRNAWDMTTWVMMRTPTTGQLRAPDEPPPSQQSPP